MRIRVRPATAARKRGEQSHVRADAVLGTDVHAVAVRTEAYTLDGRDNVFARHEVHFHPRRERDLPTLRSVASASTVRPAAEIERTLLSIATPRSRSMCSTYSTFERLLVKNSSRSRSYAPPRVAGSEGIAHNGSCSPKAFRCCCRRSSSIGATDNTGTPRL